MFALVVAGQAVASSSRTSFTMLCDLLPTSLVNRDCARQIRFFACGSRIAQLSLRLLYRSVSRPCCSPPQSRLERILRQRFRLRPFSLYRLCFHAPKSCFFLHARVGMFLVGVNCDRAATSHLSFGRRANDRTILKP